MCACLVCSLHFTNPNKTKGLLVVLRHCNGSMSLYVKSFFFLHFTDVKLNVNT